MNAEGVNQLALPLKQSNPRPVAVDQRSTVLGTEDGAPFFVTFFGAAKKVTGLGTAQAEKKARRQHQNPTKKAGLLDLEV